MARKSIPEATQTAIFLKSRRRCCLCFWLDGADEVKKGQIAHLDNNNENSAEDNLVFLCFDHHDEYDSTTRISKGLREEEVRQWRDELYKDMQDRSRSEINIASRIRYSVSKLLRFSDAFPVPDVPTHVEKILTDNRPLQLFALLMSYDENDVRQVADIGGQLFDHVTAYYALRQKLLRFENDLHARIAGIVGDTFNSTHAWDMYFRYAVLRFLGLTQDEVIKRGNFLNYGITWAGTEKVFGTLSGESSLVDKAAEIVKAIEGLMKDVDVMTSAVSPSPTLAP